MKVIIDIYRRYTPFILRYWIGVLRAKMHAKIHIDEIDEQVFQKVKQGVWMDIHKEESEYMIKSNKVLAFPYIWVESYDEKVLSVYTDKKKRMHYVMTENKRLYFPKGYPVSNIKVYFNSLLIEQDPRSPHYYFDPLDLKLKNTVFFDIGGAEGYISLRVIPVVKKLIIFECDRAWLKALQATFEPWKDKVQIINKYAGDETKGTMVKIDDIAECYENIVLKLDVEGMEMAVLNGAAKTLQKSDTKVFVCSYHKKNDEEELGELLQKNGYDIQKSDGYMFYGDKEDIGFRKGIIRAWKK